MPVRSRYTHQATRARHRQTSADPTEEPPKAQPKKVPFLSTQNPALQKVGKALIRVGKYIQTNQEAYRKSGGTPIDQDLKHFGGRVGRRTAEFGDEQSQGIQQSYRRDPDEQLLRDLQGQSHRSQQPRPSNRIEFEISHQREQPAAHPTVKHRCKFCAYEWEGKKERVVSCPRCKKRFDYPKQTAGGK